MKSVMSKLIFSSNLWSILYTLCKNKNQPLEKWRKREENLPGTFLDALHVVMGQVISIWTVTHSSNTIVGGIWTQETQVRAISIVITWIFAGILHWNTRNYALKIMQRKSNFKTPILWFIFDEYFFHLNLLFFHVLMQFS